ncbi:MAG: hypothetical protein PHE17_10240 [Thiothrix sp.]|nr:hypothetical protein [Thiothrix sp.]MDD5393386.1 hypothetical protein [Thiothrix sp.]
MKNHLQTLNLLLISFSLLFATAINPTATGAHAKTPAQKAGVFSQLA